MLPSASLDVSRNHFLAGLAADDIQRLRPHLQEVPVKLSQVLYTHGEAVSQLYFPLDSAISLITNVQEGRGVESALIGREGVVGVGEALGAKTHWGEAVVQLPGTCLKTNVDRFRDQIKSSMTLLDQLHRYIRYFLAQISQSVACNRLHRIDQRLARWLLMTHDQVNGSEFAETHEFLSRILGTDRSEVTIAAGLLRKANLITYSRGKVTVLDREKLEAASCDCYRIVRNELAQLVPKAT